MPNIAKITKEFLNGRPEVFAMKVVVRWKTYEEEDAHSTFVLKPTATEDERNKFWEDIDIEVFEGYAQSVVWHSGILWFKGGSFAYHFPNVPGFTDNIWCDQPYSDLGKFAQEIIGDMIKP